MDEFPRFPTIRQEAKFGNTTSEHHLRLLLEQGKLPGFYSGKTFRVNHDKLVAMLDGMTAGQEAQSEQKEKRRSGE